MAYVLVGLQYGDEGKARVLDKIVDKINGTHRAVMVRFNGGANAGHTLSYKGKTISLHQVPSGIFHEGMQMYIGSGCVVDPVLLVEDEIPSIEALDINIDDRLVISGKASLVQPHHKLLDGMHGGKIGTTKKGIGWTYADQAARMIGGRLVNIKFADYLVKENAKELVRKNMQVIVDRYNMDVDVDAEVERFDKAMQRLKGMRSPGPHYLREMRKSGAKIYFEGAQSVLLDSVTGTGPYVTSSRTVAGAAYTGGDFPLREHKRVAGVAKAIMSRVGNGPFIPEFGGYDSEIYCNDAAKNGISAKEEKEANDLQECLNSEDKFKVGVGLRMLGGEYGATTKRPRRVGMLDLVALKQTCEENAVDELYITKFDCLHDYSKTSLEGIPVVTGYTLNGKEITNMPETEEEQRAIEPTVEYLPHIKEDILGRESGELPTSVYTVVQKIEEYTGVPVYGIGVGPERDQFVFLREPGQ